MTPHGQCQFPTVATLRVLDDFVVKFKDRLALPHMSGADKENQDITFPYIWCKHWEPENPFKLHSKAWLAIKSITVKITSKVQHKGR